MPKIMHLCLCGPVTDGFSYQENLLAKYHKKMGFDVVLVASQWMWGKDGKLEKDGRTGYEDPNGVKMVRLPIKGDKGIGERFKRYPGLPCVLLEEAPDILFIHGCQFPDLWKVRRYLKRHPGAQAYVDNHADFSNSGTNFLSKNILHKGIWAIGARAIEPYIIKFYGVLPARVDFLRDLYRLPPEKTQLLVMGADDELAEEAVKRGLREEIRNSFHIDETDFLIVTGGKIDEAKRQTLLLMEAVKEYPDPRVKLLVFGSVQPELKPRMEELLDGGRIQYAGWVTADQSYGYFAAADAVCFPGRHSVFWEQAAGQGVPLICKYWEGTTHVDVGNNAVFLQEDSVQCIQAAIEQVKRNYAAMKACAEESGKEMFSYARIARQAVGLE